MPSEVASGLHWALKRWNSTVLNDLWFELWFYTMVALAVCLINEYTHLKFQISTAVLTVLGTALGFIISLRTSSAYERYSEGRKLWGSIALASRNLGMIIWLHVPLDRKAKDGGETPQDTRLKALIESMLNLVQAFSVSVKHYLRSEPGLYYEDLYPLLSFLPANVRGDCAGDFEKAEDEEDKSRLPMWNDSAGNIVRRNRRSTTHRKRCDLERVLPTVPNEVHLLPARSPPSDTIYDIFPPFIIFAPLHIFLKKLANRRSGDEEGARSIFGKRRDPPPINSNIPLEISLFLSSYLNMLIQESLVGPTVGTAFNNTLVSMQDAVTNLRRIRTTPIPFAYQVHLRLSTWLYLLFLPVQIYSSFGWMTIPCTAFAAYLFLGFIEIGEQIENPFQYDLNALDLDAFCLEIQRELAEIAAHPAPEPSSYIFSEWNQVFAPADRRSAATILQEHSVQGHGDKTGIHGIRHKLLENYHEIAMATSGHHK